MSEFLMLSLSRLTLNEPFVALGQELVKWPFLLQSKRLMVLACLCAVVSVVLTETLFQNFNSLLKVIVNHSSVVNSILSINYRMPSFSSLDHAQ